MPIFFQGLVSDEIWAATISPRAITSSAFGLCCVLLIGACSDAPNSALITDQAAFTRAVKNAAPGDVLTLADGTWANFEIDFYGQGTAEKPITLTAQTKGGVILTGQSNLKLSGEHLVVSGLVFKDGHTPTGEVISFRQSKAKLANNSRVTEVVIDNYNQIERREVDAWVLMYGKNNRFDHNHLVGKRNQGVTMAVRLDAQESRENNHRIDHNYFGPRQNLGSNGGETLRIGTSHYSLFDSATLIENNYFDRCDGELEIISNKSGRNTIRNNTFFRSRGTLTLRHGNNNTVEGNVFFGDGAEHTGGIRVINAGQTIRHNYMEGLKGTRFGGAFVVMNGVPNSPINRYHQVKDAIIENNSIINSDNIQLGAGSDPERGAVPIDSRFSQNLIYNDDGRDVFTVYDDMSGIKFSDNLIGSAAAPQFTDGFAQQILTLKRAGNGLLYPEAAVDVGVPSGLNVTTKDMTGVDWYPKAEPLINFGSGKTLSVTAAAGALSDAVNAALPGDTISLEAGDYTAGKILTIDKPLTFKANGAVNLKFERSTLFEIVDGGSLELIGLTISGAEAPDNAGNSVIRTSPYAMLQNYRLEILDSNFVDIDINHSFNIVSVSKGTMADHIVIKNSSFSDVTGSVLKLDKESDDYGIYNAEYVTIENSRFNNIGQGVVDLYRGGTDESTFGPHFKMTKSSLIKVGKDKRNKNGGSLFLHGVQVTDVAENSIIDSAPFVINHTVGEPKTQIRRNEFSGTPGPKVKELNSALENTAVILENSGLNP